MAMALGLHRKLYSMNVQLVHYLYGYNKNYVRNSISTFKDQKNDLEDCNYKNVLVA